MSFLKCLLVTLCYLFYLQSCDGKKVHSCPQPYSQCNLGKDGMINVHIVPHTHDDVGWLKTVDQYYYGSNLGQQDARVQYILDTVVVELAKDPSKRFVYVEIAYFWRWWNEQNDETKQLVRTLVDEKRLEFIIGAWCMNDEASTYYQDIIDQQTLGLQFILREFGECARPKVAWQIDPFGHSREQGSLFAQFGFDGLFQGRIDYQDSDYRTQKLTREMIWQASANLGDSAQIFTGILPNGYGPPDGFCFDQYCGDEPIMDDANLDEYNVNKKVDSFIQYTLNQRKAYKTDNLIMTMGSDFQYSNAHLWYKNLDKLIHYVNQQQLNGSNVNIFYSTPSCYLYSLYKSNQTWPVKTDDFFPYAHRPHSFWTGYFTSRTALKDYVRRTNNFLQTVRQLSAIANLGDDDTQNALFTLSRAMGVAQHHDAVSGTERQHVANDYAKRLSIGTLGSVPIIQHAYSGIVKHRLNKDFGNDTLQAIYCPLLNITECLPIEDVKSFALVIYNPLAEPLETFIRVPVTLPGYSVLDVNTGQTVFSEYCTIYNETFKIPDLKSKAKNMVMFKASVPAVGFTSYVLSTSSHSPVKRAARKQKLNKQSKKVQKVGDNILLRNEYLGVQFDSNGNLLQIDNIDTGLSTKISQNFCFYKSKPGNNSEPEFQASGAYIFRPDGDPICMGVSKFIVTKGEQYSEIHQVYNDWISQTIRLFDGSRALSFDWLVGPIDVSDNIGKEIITRFTSDIQSQATFYTDANGREILQRKRDYRPTWPFNQTEPVSGNYFPINSRIFIRDESGGANGRQLTFVTDRTQGGSSITDGSIEVMLHRRTLYDDSLGVSEPLNEPGFNNTGLVVTGNFFLQLNTTQNSPKLHRSLAHGVNSQPLLTFGLPQSDAHYDLLKSLSGLSAIKDSLPDNVHLLTLMKDFDSDEDNALILRLEHFYELNEDPVLSKPATVDIRELLSPTFNIIGLQELGLGANMDVSELSQRLKFNSEEPINTNNISEHSKSNTPFAVTLNPMQIRTFRLWYSS